MKLQLFDREVGRAKTAVTTQRSLGIGTVTPQATSKLATALEQQSLKVAARVKAANDVTEYSKIMAEAKLKMGVFYSSRSRDVDNYDTLTDDTDEYFKKVSTGLSKGIFDVTQKARVLQGLEQVGISMHSKAIGDATTQAVNNTKADHVHTRALNVLEASYGSDDEMRTVMMNYSNHTRALAKLGVFEEDDAEKDVLDFYSDATRGKIRRLMNESPQQAVDYLLNQQTFSRMLKPEHRENLLAQAQRLLDAQDRRAEAAHKAKEAKELKAIKDWQTINHIGMFDGILDGSVTLENLREKGEHGLLASSAYISLNKMLMNRHKEFVGSETIYQQMREQAWMGELQMAQIMTATNDEQINYDMAAQLNDELKKGATIVQTEGYKTTLAALKTKLGWSPMGIPTKKMQILIGDATIAFREALIGGTPMLEAYDRVFKSYSLLSTDIHPKPRYPDAATAKKNLKAGRELDIELNAIEFFEQRQREEMNYNLQNKPNAGAIER